MIVNGTTYHDETPKEVIDILERSRNTRLRLRIHYGDTETGCEWGDVERGHVGRSSGQIKIPLVIKTRNSLGGAGVLDHCIVLIAESKGGRCTSIQGIARRALSLSTTQRSNPMPRWRFHIHARKRGAIGISHDYIAERDGDTCDDASLKLYDEYEHISIDISKAQLIPPTAAKPSREQRVRRFAITHINRDGLRTLSFANQGRNHFDTREAAEEHLAAVKKNNSIFTLHHLYGDVDKMEVREVECYLHGDATGIYFDD